MKKILSLTLALIISCSAFIGCDKADSSSNASSKVNNSSSQTESPSSEDDKFPASTTPIDISQGATENMFKRSILNEGDTSRLAEKINFALENKKETTKICFLGDSITQGSAATSSSNQYVNQFKTWWEENVSFYVDVTNAGIGATDSYIGVHRVQRDVLDSKPDVIFIEFINDTDDDFYKSCMDSLIRKCMSLENNPAVVLVEMTTEDGGSPQRVHSEVAKEYNVPVISYHDAVMPEVEAGSFAWNAVAADVVHPNDAGHILLGKLLINYVNSVKENLANIEKVSKAFDAQSPTGDIFNEAYLGDRTNVTVKDEGSFKKEVSFQKFTGGWGTETGGSITFEMEFKNLGMLYLKTVDGKTAKVTVNIDGEDVKNIDGDFTGGWGNYAKADEVFSSNEKAKHTVVVTVDEGDAANFQILNWMIS